MRHLFLPLAGLLTIAASVTVVADAGENSSAPLTSERGQVEKSADSDVQRAFDMTSTNSGFLFVDGAYIAPPYTIMRTPTGIQINGFLVDAFDDKVELEQAVERFELIAATLDNDDVVLAFDNVEPIVAFLAGYETLSRLARHSAPSDIASSLIGRPLSLSETQRDKWLSLLESFVPTLEFSRRAEDVLLSSETILRQNLASQAAVRLLDHSAYPLTAIAMLCIAMAASHLLVHHSQLLASQSVGGPSDIDRAMKLTLAYIVAFSALDLVWTILVSQAGQMRELHPLGSNLTDNPVLLALFKGTATIVCVGLLFLLRSKPVARKASWHVCVICLLLAGRWVTVGGLML